jgi:hypothetical protein
MRDSEQEYPLHQAEYNGNPHSLNGQSSSTSPAQQQPLARQEPKSPAWQEEPIKPQLPRGRLRNALLAGVLIGFLCAAQGIAIMIANSPVYQQASTSLPAKLSFNTALAILGIQAFISLISALICLAGGFVVGKVVVQRRLGFLAGFIAGVVIYGTGFLLSYIPHYPGSRPTSGTSNATGVAGGILLALILLLITGVFAGLITLLGAWFATRRHPYYAG